MGATRKASKRKSTKTKSRSISAREILPEIKSVTYVIFCHGEEDPHIRVPIPFYKNQTIRLDYYVHCGMSLWGGDQTLEDICLGNLVPTLSILSGSTAPQMKFIGEHTGKFTDSMGIYICDKDGIDMVFKVRPDIFYSLPEMISEIMNYHAQYEKDLRQKINFSISIHSCRVFPGNPINTVQRPLVMNPETDLAEIFEKTLKIKDESPNSETGNYNVLAKNSVLGKTRQERKEEEEKRLAFLQLKINDLTHAIETLKIGKEKRKIHELDNEINNEKERIVKRKTLRSTKKNTKKNTKSQHK